MPSYQVCRDGSVYHTHPNFQRYQQCFRHDDCGEGECCLSEYCVCGEAPENQCVPPPPGSDLETVTNQEDLNGTDFGDAPSDAPSSLLSAIAPTKDLNGADFEDAPSEAPSSSPSATAPTNDTYVESLQPLYEDVPCVEFADNVLYFASQPGTDQECRTNSCSNGCCRVYRFLRCDEENEASTFSGSSL